MDFSQVKAITIPEGNVTRILSGATVLWKKTGGLPTTYQQVEYIEGTGTQYIDTGVLATSGLSMDERMSYVTVPRDSCFVGTRVGATRFYLHHTYPSTFAYGYGNWQSSDVAPQAGVIYNIHTDLSVGDQKMYVDGVEVRSGSSTNAISLDYTLYIFCMNQSGSAAYFTEGRLYELKIYKDGDKIRDFVPCYRKSDNVAGLYDLVNGVFYTNAGTGVFTVGPKVFILPTGYQQVEYIEGTGTQYIDTTIYPALSDGLYAKFQFVSGNLDNYRPFGAYSPGVAVDSVSGLRIWTTGGAVSINPTNKITDGNVHTIQCSADGTWDYDGETVLTSKPIQNQPNKTITLFKANYTNGTLYGDGTSRMYNFQYFRNGETICSLVPCYRKSDNVAGLYDVINDVFYTNAGTGVFTVGPEVFILPSGYQQVGYVESDGQAYIDSGIECTGDLVTEFSAMHFDAANTAICGGIDMSNAPYYFRHHCSPTNYLAYWLQDGNLNYYSNQPISANTQYTVYVNPLTGECTLNGSDTYTLPALDGSETTGKSYGIFARISDTGAIQSKASRFYYFKFYRNDILIGNFVPCYHKSDGEIGMYDFVSATFFTNSGSGTFTKGADVT